MKPITSSFFALVLISVLLCILTFAFASFNQKQVGGNENNTSVIVEYIETSNGKAYFRDTTGDHETIPKQDLIQEFPGLPEAEWKIIRNPSYQGENQNMCQACHICSLPTKYYWLIGDKKIEIKFVSCEGLVPFLENYSAS